MVCLKHADDEKCTTGVEFHTFITLSLSKEILTCSFCSLWLVQLVLVTPCFQSVPNETKIIKTDINHAKNYFITWWHLLTFVDIFLYILIFIVWLRFVNHLLNYYFLNYLLTYLLTNRLTLLYYVCFLMKLFNLANMDIINDCLLHFKLFIT